MANESLSLRFLYNTVPGRAVLKCLVRPEPSKLAGAFLSSVFSVFLIKPFMRKNRLTLSGIDVPKNGFSSFNDFFARKRVPEAVNDRSDLLFSPCDAFVSLYDIDNSSRFEIKHSLYSVSELLDDSALAEEFRGGTMMIFRLTPRNYHRYNFAADGRFAGHRRIDGELHTVRPIALSRYPVYIRNSREYAVIDSECFGRLIQMEVGALLVGKIKNFRHSGSFRHSDEKGYFEFGGSTIVLMFGKNSVRLSPSLVENCADGREIPVRQGDILGEKY